MFAYLEGKLTYKSPSLLYLDVSGTGYEINITLQTYALIQNSDKCKLYIHHQIREDAWVLFGFAEEEERATFRQLLAISGVGALTARIILSSLTTDELERAVMSEDAKLLEKIKGIGTKTAQRIILELKGKVLKTKNPGAQVAFKHNTAKEDALIALVNLGINKAMAEGAIKKLGDLTGVSVEEIIKKALRAL